MNLDKSSRTSSWEAYLKEKGSGTEICADACGSSGDDEDDEDAILVMT